MQDSELIQFTQTCIRTKSFTGQEQEIINLVCQRMVQLGFDRVWVDSAGSAIGEIRGKMPGHTILLDAHADTVLANSGDWQFDPFGAEIKGNHLYGRGSADTKGNLAAMIYGASNLNRDKIHGNVFVSASVHEENYEGGSLEAIIEAVKPDFVVIGEATNLNLNHGGRGRAEIILETHGLSAHSSSPQAGRCAVHEMMDVIRVIESQEVLQDPFLGSGSMVLTDIISQPYPGHSVIPNTCRVTFDRRLILDETVEGVINGLKALLHSTDKPVSVSIVNANEFTYTGYKLEGKKFFPAWFIPAKHPMVTKSLSALRSLQPETQLGVYQFCTNAAFSAGIAGIPTIGYGLGNESDAHTVDESIDIDQLHMAAVGYKTMIENVLDGSI